MIREGGPPAVDVSWDSMVRGRVGGSEATSSSTHSSLEAKTSEALPDHEGVALTAAVRTGGPRAGMAGGGPCVGGDWRHSRRVDLVQSLRLLITESSVSRVNEPYCGGLRSLDRLYLERPREQGREEEDEELYLRLRRLPLSLSEPLWLRCLDLRSLLDLADDESDAERVPGGENPTGGAPFPLGPGREGGWTMVPGRWGR